MDMDYDGLRGDIVQMLGGGRARVNTRSFQNDMRTFKTKDDVLTLPSAGKPALVVELKYDRTASTAIQQIRDRKYTQALEGYTGEILLVGINYDKANRNKSHSCVIERVEKRGA